jgi:hypothetical protein
MVMKQLHFNPVLGFYILENALFYGYFQLQDEMFAKDTEMTVYLVIVFIWNCLT